MKKFSILMFVLFVFTNVNNLALGQEVKRKKSLAVDSIVNSLIYTLNTHYILNEQAIEMVNVLKQQMKAGIYKSLGDPAELASRLEKDIKNVYPDKHLYIYYDPEFEQDQKVSQVESAKYEAQKHELEYEKSKNFMFTTAKILPRNIGYVQLNGFSDLVDQAEPTATAAFSFLSHTSAIIIDLRYNSGGNPRMVEQLESYFFNNKTHMSDIQERSSNRITSFYADPLKAKGISLTMPVYILTSKRTFSAAEDFAYSMQQIKRAQVVGDTTAGGAHPTKPYVLKGGFVAEIPFARSINPYSKKNWEGSGLIPDIPVQSSKALEKALEQIYLKEMAYAINDKQKRSIAWQINSLNSAFEYSVSTDVLKKYCGEYQGGLNIYMQNGNLYCRNAERGNDVYKLIPLSNSMFTLDENAHVEFIEEENKNIKLRMHFVDGNDRDKARL